MSDNIAEQEIWKRYVLFMSIPNETWTDILKLLSRRILVQKISPVCKRLKNISNRNVENIHEIMEAAWFSEKLKKRDPEANQQLEHLAGNNCHLASQFRMTEINIIQENKAVLQHCIELFRHCRLSFSSFKDLNTAFIVECLTHLEAAKPIAIVIRLYHFDLELQLMFLRHPTTWECSRISLLLPFSYDVAIAALYYDWLHHKPIGNDDGYSEQHDEVRCLIIKGTDDYDIVQDAIHLLIERCTQNLQQSQGLEDRRRFVFSFSVLTSDDETTLLDQFERRQNQATGEVLLLEHADAANQIASKYRLRRCLAEEAHNGNEFYEKTFKRNGHREWDEFVVNEDDGPSVGIY